MNRGLAAGYIVNPEGKGVANAYVRLMKVEGGASGIIPVKGSGRYSEIETRTDAYGRFNIPFLWSGAEFGEGISSTVVVAKFKIVAYTERNTTGGGSEVLASGKGDINAFLYKDIKGLLQSKGPLLSNTDLQYYASYLKSYIGKYLSGRFWNTAMLTTESWLMLGAGVIGITPYSSTRELEFDNEQDYELMPELEMIGNAPNNYSPLTKSSPHKCSCSHAGSTSQSMKGDPAVGWEQDNESFTVHTANHHLNNFYRANDRVQKVYSCCIDPDFFFRKCEFITARNVKGSVVWWPTNKKAGISVCINGQKNVCWYDYSVDPRGQLILRNRSCLKSPSPC